MDGHIMRCGIISLPQSAETSEILRHKPNSRKQHYNKCPDYSQCSMAVNQSINQKRIRVTKVTNVTARPLYLHCCKGNTASL